MEPISFSGGLVLRDAKPGDAKPMNAFLGITYKTARNMITRPDEFSSQTYSRRMWIARKAMNPLECCMVVVRGKNEIIGMLDSWADRRERVHHTTGFTMSVHPKTQGRGIGRRLLMTFIQFVAAHPTLRRIDLHVHSDNLAAYKLYRSVGFIEEGRRKGAILYEDGRVVDDILMALWPGDDQPDCNADLIDGDARMIPGASSFQDTLASTKS